ncbi:uncharacterized protein THITE_2121526 [Thermothielavioides terrestris NRRL 8126]|uniref:Mid2 domain-containing protein n=1 Tax=Thermothielavioides terrestris (strain ATCC 38088 / NRRL 8126) TaxID=578455 RepID=G2RF12_THETT|nr:uncharacterized protein THITE_2121526 [Thermothielavioides terrestris NRRL 8126]AEO70295.1 hypothetical protein THITE_2121526 [Thermothielavioides terrestris NRRL 8126]
MVRAIGLRALTLLLATFPPWPWAEAACYYPSGRLAPNDAPCRDDTPNATCCGQGYACLSNNICQATGEELQKPGATEFVRGSCTDKQWRSSSCPLFCIQDGVDLLDGGNGIFKCPNTTEDLYFCIDALSATEASCDKKQNVLFFPGTPTVITTIGVSPRTTSSSTTSSSTSEAVSSSTSTPAASTSTSQASSTSASPTESQSAGSQVSQAPADAPSNNGPGSSSNIGPIVGGVVGGTAAVILAGVGGWLLARKRTSTGAGAGSDRNGAQAEVEPKVAVDSTVPYHAAHAAIHEVPGSMWPSQMQQAHAQQRSYERREPTLAELPAGRVSLSYLPQLPE